MVAVGLGVWPSADFGSWMSVEFGSWIEGYWEVSRCHVPGLLPHGQLEILWHPGHPPRR